VDDFVTPNGEGAMQRPLADYLDDRALTRAVGQMIEDVLSKWDHTRPLGSLNKRDLARLADAAITGWVLERAAMGICEQSSDLPFDAAFVTLTSGQTLGLIERRPSQNAAVSRPKRKRKA
jgi:hypothetical protein